MNRLDEKDDDALRPDERLRAALRHAPDAQREAPAALTARILSTARAATAASPAAAPAHPKRRRGWRLGALPLPVRGLALGLLALAAGAFWLLQPREEAAPPVDLRMAKAPAPSAELQPAPLVVAQAEVLAQSAPLAVEPRPAPARDRSQAARKLQAPPQDRPEMHAAIPEVRVMSPAPPPVVEFKPAPPPAAAPMPPPPVVAALVREPVPVASAAASPALPVNPARAWLAALPGAPEAESAPRGWLLVLAELTDGRWQDEPLAPPSVETRLTLLGSQRERPNIAQAASAERMRADPAETWAPPEIEGRRAGLQLLRQGLRWCEAGRCWYAPLSESELRRLREQRQPAAPPREPASGAASEPASEH